MGIHLRETNLLIFSLQPNGLFMLLWSISILRVTNSRSIQESFASFQSHYYIRLLWPSCHYVCKRRPIFHGKFMNKFVWLVHCQTMALFVVHIHYNDNDYINTLYVHQKKIIIHVIRKCIRMLMHSYQPKVATSLWLKKKQNNHCLWWA